MATRTKEAPKKPAGEPKQNIGKVVQVIGPVLDVEFEPEHLPEIYNAVVIDHRGNSGGGGGGGGGTPSIRLTADVLLHLGRRRPTASSAVWRWWIPASRSRCRWARRRWAASSTCWVSRWTKAMPFPPTPSAGRSTARRRSSSTWSPRRKSSRRGSRSST